MSALRPGAIGTPEYTDKKLAALRDKVKQLHADLAKLTRDAATENARLREQRDVLRNALEAVLHGDYVHYELSETPRKLALAALVAVAASDAREKGDRR